MTDIFSLSPARLLIRLLVPIALGFTVLMCVDFADVVVARMISVESTAVLGYCYPLLYFIMSIGVGLNQGLTIIGAEENLKRGKKALYHFVAQSCVIAVMLAVVLALGTLALIKFRWIDQEMLPYFEELRSYLMVLILAILPMFLLLISCAICQIKGKPEVIRDTLFIMLGLTLFAHPILALPTGFVIQGPMFKFSLFKGYDLGLVGIAISKTAITFIGFMYSVNKIIDWQEMKCANLSIRWQSLVMLARQTLPASFIQLLVPVYLMMLTKMVAGYGVNAIAGFSLGYRIVMVVIIPILGVLVALLMVITHDMVSGSYHRVKQTIAIILTWGSVTVLTVLSCAYWVSGKVFAGLGATGEVEVVALQYLRLAMYITVIEFLIGVFTVSFQSIKKPAIAFLVQMSRAIIFPAPIFYIAHQYNISMMSLWNWVALSFTLSGLCSAVIMYLFFWKPILVATNTR